MNRFSLLFIAALVALAGCGGGGDSSVTGGLPPTNTNAVALHGGFEQTISVLDIGRRADVTKRSPMSTSLSALPLAAVFDVPDSYISGGDPSGIAGAQVIAYLTTSDGTLNGIPSPLPTPLITQSGPQMVIGSPVPAPSPLPSAPPVSLGGYNLSAPNTTGQTVLTISTIVAGQQLTATVKGDNYPSLCIASSDIPPNSSASAFNCPVNGLYWDAQGQDHVAPTVSSADVYLQYNSADGTTTLEFPYGATEVSESLIYNQLDVPTIAPTATSFSGLSIYNAEAASGPLIFVFRTQSGFTVKWALTGQAAGSGGVGVNGGDSALMAGPYLATNSTAFTY